MFRNSIPISDKLLKILGSLSEMKAKALNLSILF